jgi:ribosome-binding factor A
LKIIKNIEKLNTRPFINRVELISTFYSSVQFLWVGFSNTTMSRAWFLLLLYFYMQHLLLVCAFSRASVYLDRNIATQFARRSELSALLKPHSPFRSRKEIVNMKMARILRDELTNIIVNGKVRANRYPDSRLLKFTSVNDVQLNSDCSVARVDITVAGNAAEKRFMLVWLNENSQQLKHELHQHMNRFRKLPSLSFFLRDVEESRYILKVFDEIDKTN